MSQEELENHAADSHCPLEEELEKPAVVEYPRYRTHGISSNPKANVCYSAQQPEATTVVPDQQSSFNPKKKLTLSSCEKERLLNWDLTTPGTFSSMTTAVNKAERYSREPDNSRPHQAEPEHQPERSSAPVEPEPNPPLSGFQQWANTLRRSFSGAGNNPKVIRRHRPPRPRPLSEGSFSFNFLFGVSAKNQEEEEEDVGMRTRADKEGSQSLTAGRSEITAMLEQVTLNNRPSGASKDDMASMPQRKLNFFSSMRLKRNEGGDGSETDNQAKNVWNILSKLRNKGVQISNHGF